MRSWRDSTFIFISTHPRHDEGGVEERWVAVMRELRERGANVRFLCLMDSPAAKQVRDMGIGIEVDPYILDTWNVIRARSRLRKYFKRYIPVAVHSTGLEADLLSRWAARKVPVVKVAHTLPVDGQATRRKRPIDALFRRFDELGMRNSAAVFVPTPELEREVLSAGVDQSRVVLDAPTDAEAVSVERHMALYMRLMKERGSG